MDVYQAVMAKLTLLVSLIDGSVVLVTLIL
jgi:hypothetical protein